MEIKKTFNVNGDVVELIKQNKFFNIFRTEKENKLYLTNKKNIVLDIICINNGHIYLETQYK